MQSNKINLLTLTTYPPKSTHHAKDIGGLASYSKNTVTHLKEDFEITVLAQKIDNTLEGYEEDGVKVVRTWEKKGVFKYFKIIKQIYNLRKVHTKLLIQFEFGIYGHSEYVTGFFPLVIIGAKLIGYEVIVVQHQVLEKLSDLSGHLGIEERGIVNKIKGFLLQTYYKFLLKPADKVIVFDEIHKRRLNKHINTEKVAVIPHGVEEKKVVEVKDDDESVFISSSHNTFILGTFGFIAWYKGTDWLVEAFNVLQEEAKARGVKTNFKLLIAGGESPTQKNSPVYQEFFKKFQKGIKDNDDIVWTGFVPEAQIPNVFQETDLFILPYRTLMSTSGPLSWALTYEKPFLLSDTLLPYSYTSDFNQSMKRHHLNPKDFTFNVDDRADSLKQFADKILDLAEEKNLQKVKQIQKLSQDLSHTRKWSRVGEMYKEVLKN